MSKRYSFEWLYNLVTVTLNPGKTGNITLTPDEAAKIQSRIIAEKDKIQSAIIATVSKLKEEVKIRCEIKKCHSYLTFLQYQAFEDQALISGNPLLQQVLDTAISCIDEIISLIEKRFDLYLSVEQRVSVICLESVKNELIKWLSVVEKKLVGHEASQLVFKILKQELQAFLDQPYGEHTYTFLEINYLKDLCLELARFEPVDGGTVYCGLDELLINMNFNSKAYFRNLIQRLKAHINATEPADEKRVRLLSCRILLKELQLPKEREIIFHSKGVALHNQVSDWFDQEELYLEKILEYSMIPSTGVEPKEDNKKGAAEAIEDNKISSELSVDQMALLFRHAYELNIIYAPSQRCLFKKIATCFSTPGQENISAESLRIKSYSVEESDITRVTEVLLEIIEKINEQKFNLIRK